MAKSTNSALKSRALATLLPLLLVAAGGCDIAIADHSEKVTSEWTKTFEIGPGGRFEVSNVNGKVQVLPADGTTVEVVAKKIGSGATPEAAKEALERIQIAESVSGNSVKVETKLDRGNWSRGGGSVEYTVRVPRSVEVKAVTVNGGVDVRGIEGRVVAEATNGGVRAREIGGPIEASTTNGGVDVELTRVAPEGAKLECTNGGIELRLPKDAQASISARVTNGGIDTGGLAIQAVGESSRRRLNGNLNGGGPRISLEGTNGGIRIAAR